MRGFVLLVGVALLALAGSVTTLEPAPAPLELKPQDAAPRVMLDAAPPVLVQAKLEAPKRLLLTAAPGAHLDAPEAPAALPAPSPPTHDGARSSELKRLVRTHPSRAGP